MVLEAMGPEGCRIRESRSGLVLLIRNEYGTETTFIGQDRLAPESWFCCVKQEIPFL